MSKEILIPKDSPTAVTLSFAPAGDGRSAIVRLKDHSVMWQGSLALALYGLASRRFEDISVSHSTAPYGGETLVKVEATIATWEAIKESFNAETIYAN